MAKQAANRTISTFIDHIIIVPIELRVSLTCMCFKLEEIHKKKILKNWRRLSNDWTKAIFFQIVTKVNYVDYVVYNVVPIIIYTSTTFFWRIFLVFFCFCFLFYTINLVLKPYNLHIGNILLNIDFFFR